MKTLIERLRRNERGLRIETEIEIALFQPCDLYASVTANAAATKLRYVRTDGSIEHCGPQDWDQDPAETITLLEAISGQQEATKVAA